MAKPNLTRSLLTLFVTPEKAEEIEGDLIEQARAHSRSWLRVQLVQTWFALAFAAFRREPGHTVLLSFTIFELSKSTYHSILYPIRLYVLRDTDLSMDILALVTHACWVLLSYCIGAASAYFLPKYAVRATLGAAFLMLFSSFGIYVVLFVIAPLLTGCFYMHSKRLVQAPLFNKTA